MKHYILGLLSKINLNHTSERIFKHEDQWLILHVRDHETEEVLKYHI